MSRAPLPAPHAGTLRPARRYLSSSPNRRLVAASTWLQVFTWQKTGPSPSGGRGALRLPDTQSCRKSGPRPAGFAPSPQLRGECSRTRGATTGPGAGGTDPADPRAPAAHTRSRDQQVSSPGTFRLGPLPSPAGPRPLLKETRPLLPAPPGRAGAFPSAPRAPASESGSSALPGGAGQDLCPSLRGRPPRPGPSPLALPLRPRRQLPTGAPCPVPRPQPGAGGEGAAAAGGAARGGGGGASTASRSGSRAGGGAGRGRGP